MTAPALRPDQDPARKVEAIAFDADRLAGRLNDPWIWSYLGPEKLGKARDALDDLRSALCVPEK